MDEILILLVSGALSIILLFAAGAGIVRNRRRDLNEWLFVVFAAACSLWILTTATAAAHAGKPLEGIYTSISGLFGLLTALAAYIFIEYLPGSRSPGSRRRRVILAGIISFSQIPLHFTDLWGKPGAPGPYYFVQITWIQIMLVGGFGIIAVRYRRETDPQARMRLGTFLIGGGAGALVTAVFTLILPLFNRPDMIRFGTVGAILAALGVAYAIVFHQLFDLRGALLQSIVWISSGSLILTGGVALIRTAFPENISITAWIVFAASLAYLHAVLLQPRITGLLQKFIGHSREDINALVTRIIAIEAGPDSDEAALFRVMDQTIHSLKQMLDFEKGFIVLADRFRRLNSRASGIPPESLAQAGENTLRLLRRRLRVPGALLSPLQHILMLEMDWEKSLVGNARAVRRYQRTAASLYDFTRQLHQEKYAILLPLLFRQEFFGMIVLGRRTGGRPYVESDIRMLEIVRLPIAVALHNAVLVEELRETGKRAEKRAFHLAEEIHRLHSAIHHRAEGKAFVYVSDLMKSVHEQAKKCAGRNLPVLITGETGTGKEIMARIIHAESRSAQGPLVSVNCAAIPRELLESEVFGHRKGAFTGAARNHRGFVEQASDGTLFFDEVGELPLDLQAKLLRLLQERKYVPVGAEKPLNAKCRFIFATNRDLQTLHQQGQFRADLFHRISVLQVHLPPLRERRDDIRPLIDYFISAYNLELETRVELIEIAARDALCRHSWPGNIRELENCIIQAMLAAAGDRITLDDLPAQIVHEHGAHHSIRRETASAPGPAAADTRPFDAIVQEFSRTLLVSTIRRCGGNKTKAARELGLNRARLYYQLNELNILDSELKPG